jgi:hypothetical protein
VPTDEIAVARLAIWLARTFFFNDTATTEIYTDALGLRMLEFIALDPSVQAAGTTLGETGAVVTEAADHLELAVASGDEAELVAAIAELVAGMIELFDAIRALVDVIGSKTSLISDISERQAVEALLGTLASDIVDYLVLSVLEMDRPRLLFLLKLLGVVDWTVVEADPSDMLSRRHVRKAIRLDRIQRLFEDPAGHFESVLGWGTPSFDPSELLQIFASFHGEESAVEFGRLAGDPFLEKGPFRWSVDSSLSPPGARLDVEAALRETLQGRVGLTDVWGATVEGSIIAEAGITAVARAPFDITVESNATASGAVLFFVDRNEDARPFSIIGGNDLVRLEADNLTVGAALEVGASTTVPVSVEPRLISDIAGLKLTIGSAGADSFLASLLAGLDIDGVFDLGLEWRGAEGLVIKAAGGLEVAIPMHQSLGPVEFETLFIVFSFDSDGAVTLELSATITGLLGPLAAAVERMGVTLNLTFTEGAGGRFGPIDASLAFKPPNGVGLSIDIGVIKGGGYLYIDVDKGEYAGAIELVFSGFLSLSAIGIISTRMPDGSEGFSLLIVVTAEFGVPLQLGFGFTLIGVGGLLGLNRTADVEQLALGVRDGSIESVMFPTDVIANAPQIISDMRRFFPAEEDTFLIGLMAKLGWGTPTLVSASLGIVIEVPPGNIIILGILKVALPDEDAALLVLQVNFIGAYEVDKERIWFFASLYESRVLFITIGGDMGLLIGWGADANFVVSVGGFHPSFSPPPLPFPTPSRVSVSLLNESFATVRVEGYFAVTSNTAQFGASAELFFGLSEFSIEGHIGFDALFQFSPFAFIISFSASLSVKVFGIGLYSVRIRGEFEGTSPWYIEGEGSISLLFFDIDVPFSHGWGEDANTVLPAIPALPILRDELLKRDNWTAVVPTGSHLSVALRTIEGSTELVLHPVGTLMISQRAMPLDLQLDKIGNQPVSDIERATLRVDDPDLERLADAAEPFATAQFQDIADSAKLSAPAFEDQDAGILVGVAGDDVTTSHAVKRIVFHELIIIDSNFKEHVQRFFNIGLLAFTHFLRGNAAARSPLSAATALALDPFDSRITVGAATYAVASSMDNSIVDEAARFTSKAKADDYLRQAVSRDPALQDAIHVVPATELQVVA